MFYHAPIIAIGTRIEFIPKGAQYGGSSETKVLYLQQVFFVNASQSYDFLSIMPALAAVRSSSAVYAEL